MSNLEQESWVLDNSVAQTIYKGQPMILDKSADTVYARGWLAATTLVTATDVRLGIAAEGAVVLTADTETDNEITIYTAGEVGLQAGALTDADVGTTITMSDSGTLSTDAEAADKLYLGVLKRVEDGYAFIDLGSAPHIQTF